MKNEEICKIKKREPNFWNLRIQLLERTNHPLFMTEEKSKH